MTEHEALIANLREAAQGMSEDNYTGWKELCLRAAQALSAPQEAAEMTEEAVRLWLAQRGRMSVPRSDYLKAIAPASLREAQIQAVASAVDACEERGCKECAGMLRGEIHRLRAWDFKDSRSAPQEASKVEPVADEPFGWFYEMDRKANPKASPVYLGGNDQRIVQTVADDEGATAFPLYLRPSQQALSDEEIIDLVRVASTVNNYSNGRFASAIFEREHAIAFARAILAAAGGSEK